MEQILAIEWMKSASGPFGKNSTLSAKRGALTPFLSPSIAVDCIPQSLQHILFLHKEPVELFLWRPRSLALPLICKSNHGPHHRWLALLGVVFNLILSPLPTWVCSLRIYSVLTQHLPPKHWWHMSDWLKPETAVAEHSSPLGMVTCNRFPLKY